MSFQGKHPVLDFTEQNILVIGGSSGIGQATAKLARELGANVTIASRSKDKLEAAAKKIGAAMKVMDVTNEQSIEDALSGISWDHIIVTGSDVKMAAVKALPLTDAMAAMDSKFWGFYRVARAAQIRPGGSLGVVAGFLATRPASGRALMGAINGALESLVQGLALELKPVRVNAVSPAVVDTEMWHGLAPEARQTMLATLAERYPAGTVGQPLDIARQLLLLAGTPYATGTIVTLDGGASLA
jgi:NAD(P)-dependent dehydrogenase (short-subunit alcohol dehydrogenase family)